MYRADLQCEDDIVAYVGIDVYRTESELHDGIKFKLISDVDEKTRRTPPMPTVTAISAALTAQAAERRVAIAKERILLVEDQGNIL